MVLYIACIYIACHQKNIFSFIKFSEHIFFKNSRLTEEEDTKAYFIQIEKKNLLLLSV